MHTLLRSLSVSLISRKSPSAPRTETPTLLSAASASDISASVVSPEIEGQQERLPHHSGSEMLRCQKQQITIL